MVMPYVKGKTLEEFLHQQGKLPFPQIQRYLEQLAGALDYAHERGILHRDIKTRNILFQSADELLLTDFGLAGLTTERNFARARQRQPGMLNYIAPEYVLSRPVTRQADLYSLGVVLYQMVTGTVPFQGAELSEVAMQHVNAAPPVPRQLREDLPQGAQQVLLRALAKQPDERYTRAGEMALAFRLALEAEGLLPTIAEPGNETIDALAMLSDLASGGATTKIPRLKGTRKSSLFDPRWQTVAEQTDVEQPPTNSPATVPPTPVLSAIPEQTTVTMAEQLSFPGGAQANNPGLAASTRNLSPDTSEQTLQLANKGSETTEALHVAGMKTQPGRPEQYTTTGMLQKLSTFPGTGQQSGATATIKLTEPVKIVQVPVAGQPGRVVTGFLSASNPGTLSPASEPTTPKRSRRLQLVSLLLVVLVIVGSISIYAWVARSHTNKVAQITVSATQPTDQHATATAQVTATQGANIVLFDDLSQNIHDWPIGQQGHFSYTFNSGAYDITNNDPQRSAPAILPARTLSGSYVYSLTMEQLKGDQTSLNNQFGMIFDATIQSANGKQIDTFYAFEVLNKAEGDYQFWKYDNGKNSSDPWTSLWSKNFGKEFHQGSGSSHINTLKVKISGQTFTFLVNGTQVGTWKDGSFTRGNVGMLVNLDGAEVAFSDLLITNS
jgi:serine/threonine protein kinase